MGGGRDRDTHALTFGQDKGPPLTPRRYRPVKLARCGGIDLDLVLGLNKLGQRRQTRRQSVRACGGGPS